MCFGLNLFRLSVCLAALPHNLYSFQFLDAYPSKLRKSLLNDKKWYNILAIIHIFEHLVCFCVFIQTVQGINIVYLCLKHLQMCFLFNMAAASEQSFSRCCVMKHSLWWHEDQSNPDFTHASDDTHMKIFFFPHIWATWWILNGYQTAEDAKILTRCEGRDLQIIRLKQGWGGSSFEPCACQSSVTMWLAVRQLDRKGKEGKENQIGNFYKPQLFFWDFMFKDMEL